MVNGIFSNPVVPILQSTQFPPESSATSSQVPQPPQAGPVPATEAPLPQGATEARGDRRGFWAVFLSTFFTILLAEIGDKTQVAVLLISAESGQPWIVFGGAALALITTSLLGVLVGRWLSRQISPRTLDTLAGILLLGITLGLLWDIATL